MHGIGAQGEALLPHMSLLPGLILSCAGSLFVYLSFHQLSSVLSPVKNLSAGGLAVINCLRV